MSHLIRLATAAAITACTAAPAPADDGTPVNGASAGTTSDAGGAPAVTPTLTGGSSVGGRSGTGQVLPSGGASAGSAGATQAPSSCSADGTEMPWVVAHGTGAGDDATGLEIAPDGDVMVAGSTAGDLGGEGNAGSTDPYVMKLSSVDGSVLWIRQSGTSAEEYAVDLGLDAEGDAFVAGMKGNFMDPNDVDAFGRKVSGTDGATIWEQALASTEYEGAQAVAVNAAGDAVVVGSTRGDLGSEGNAGASDAYVVKLSGDDGAVVWTVQFGGTDGDTANGVGIDVAQDVFVAGSVSGEPADGAAGVVGYLAKLSGETGAMLWRKTYQPDSGASTLVVDPTGDVFIAGTVEVDFVPHPFVRRVSSADGEVIWEVPTLFDAWSAAIGCSGA